MATPHKHVELIKKWADDTSQAVWFWYAPGMKWSRAVDPAWSESNVYSVGEQPSEPPKSVATLGDISFPAFESELPRMREVYYVATLEGVCHCNWENSPEDRQRLEEGLIHLDRDSAKLHSQAIRKLHRENLKLDYKL